jgi:hypothetical protein
MLSLSAVKSWIASLLLLGRLVAVELVAEPLRIEGALEGERFDLVVEGSMGSRLEVWGVTSEMDGVDLEPFLPGEQVRIVASSQIRSEEGELVLVPHPMAAAENGYRLTLTTGEGYTVRASGFEGEGMVTVVTREGDECREFALPVCRGCITFGYAPEGEFTIELRGERGEVTLAGH